MAAVPADRLLPPCAVTVLVDGKVSRRDSGTQNSERTTPVVELGGHETLMPAAVAVAGGVFPSHGWESTHRVKGS